MRKFSILIALILVVAGVYFLINDWPTLSFIGSMLFIAGIVSFTTDLLFSADEPHDERIQTIKVKAGHISYILSIIYTFVIILLFQYNVIEEPLNGFIFILIGNVLLFPIAIIYHNKTM